MGRQQQGLHVGVHEVRGPSEVPEVVGIRSAAPRCNRRVGRDVCGFPPFAADRKRWREMGRPIIMASDDTTCPDACAVPDAADGGDYTIRGVGASAGAKVAASRGLGDNHPHLTVQPRASELGRPRDPLRDEPCHHQRKEP
jgi:hypothetical protein